MTWVPVERILPMDGERVRVKLESGKELDVIFDDGAWLDPKYLPGMRVEFCNVTAWSPIGGPR